MSKTPMTKMKWVEMENRVERACHAADEITSAMNAPIDPMAFVRSEGGDLLRCRGEDFGDAFDGQLRYDRTSGRFVMLYNNKYDRGRAEGHHPRTRFSIAHELAHYFLDKHRAYLMRGGEHHPSHGEFDTDTVVEREADAFAAAMLMPTRLAKPLVNEDELSLALVRRIKETFDVSLVSASLRAVQLSDYHAAVVGLCDGRIAWSFRSKVMRESGFYPPEKISSLAASASGQWHAFESGGNVDETGASFAKHWFRTYERADLDHLHVDEHYIPVISMGILVVLLAISEDQMLFDDDD